MTTWTNQSQSTSNWTNQSLLQIEEETLFNDTNYFNVTESGKGKHFNDRTDSMVYTNASTLNNTWTVV